MSIKSDEEAEFLETVMFNFDDAMDRILVKESKKSLKEPENQDPKLGQNVQVRFRESPNHKIKFGVKK